MKRILNKTAFKQCLDNTNKKLVSYMKYLGFRKFNIYPLLLLSERWILQLN